MHLFMLTILESHQCVKLLMKANRRCSADVEPNWVPRYCSPSWRQCGRTSSATISWGG